MLNILTKDRKAVARGKRCELALDFQSLNDAALVKLLGIDPPDGYVAGWASTSDIDSYNHMLAENAFAESIASRSLRGPKSIKLLIGHDWDKHAGEIKVLEYRGGRLWIEAQMNLNISYVRDAHEAAKMIGGTNFSVGFMLQDYEFIENEDGSEYLKVNRGDLFEVSIVPFPGNEEAIMSYIKDASGGAEKDAEPQTLSEFEKALVASGLAKSRNDAKAITQVVKTCHLLFEPKDHTVEPEEKKTAPALDAGKLTELTALVAKMKQVIAPVAATPPEKEKSK